MPSASAAEKPAATTPWRALRDEVAVGQEERREQDDEEHGRLDGDEAQRVLEERVVAGGVAVERLEQRQVHAPS
jgi:hypothetical protein